MEKYAFEDYSNQQLVDVRMQQDYQNGHLPNSLNLNPSNFKKYASYYLDPGKPILFIVENENTDFLQDLADSAEEMGFSKIDGYLIADELPKERLITLPTLPANEFMQLEEDYILLDVRHPDEITRLAPEKNLVNIPFEKLIDEHLSLDSNKKVYTLCGSGNRSTAAASYLLIQGFTPIVVEGGMKAIQEVSK